MTAVSISGVLVMVSSELVVLLIVCVGINTGSVQDQPGELVAPKFIILQSLLVYIIAYYPQNLVKKEPINAILTAIMIITSLNVCPLH